MKVKLTAILAAVVAGATINTTEAGLLPGMPVVADMFAPVGGFSGTARWQTSTDGTVFTDVGTAWVTTAGGYNSQQITLAQYIRLNVSAYATGSVQGRVISDID